MLDFLSLFNVSKASKAPFPLNRMKINRPLTLILALLALITHIYAQNPPSDLENAQIYGVFYQIGFGSAN